MESRPLPFLIIDLIIQILSWLPVKSLVRFRCVSKSWNSLISQPSFVQLHLQHYSAKHTTENILLTLNYEHVAPFSVSSLLQDPSSTISDYRHQYYFQLGTIEEPLFLDSYNGLVCLCDCSYADNRGSQIFRFLFWNPATRLISKAVPPYYRLGPNVDSENDSDDYYDSEYDSEDEPIDELYDFHFGFGYDDSTYTYKLVGAFITGSQPHRTTLRAYTMGCDYWRNISGLDDFPRIVGGGNGCFVSGTLNWRATFDYDNFPYVIGEVVIVSLDLRTETYKQLSLPIEEEENRPQVGSNSGELVVMRGLLCFYRYDTKTHFVLWQMKEFGNENSWTRLVKIQKDDFLRSVSPVCISDNGDVVVLANRITSEAILYNRRDNRVESTRIPIRILDLEVNDYVPSLVLPL